MSPAFTPSAVRAPNGYEERRQSTGGEP